MNSRLILCSVLLLSSVASAIPGGCEPINDSDKKDVAAGKEKIISRLEQALNDEPGYKTTADLPDLTVCRQVVSGTEYNYKWTKIVYKTKCTHDPKSNALCLPEKEKTVTKDLTCSASYWIKPWDKSFKPQLQGPRCK